ncbi:MAG: HAMP domain-containing sensor histidine kinase [Myxococcales bacterium]|nr:HAMP domain-containing histidine kinase [Myxococcota bacterium]MDW8282487.1 HAMP domain-containing sensor histidine kinase [Myxococcales bacterium]
MTLRRRTFILVSAAIFGILLLSLTIVDMLVGAALRRQLDGALRVHARTEAASCFDRPGGAAHVHEDPVTSSEAALTKYAAIYDMRSGQVLISTRTLPQPPPVPPMVRAAVAAGGEFLMDLHLAGAPRLRAIWVPAPTPSSPRALLLLAVPDEMVVQVRRKLRAAAVFTASCGLLLAFAVARLLAGRLLRGTEAIAQTARAVSAGDLTRRVDVRIPDEEIAGLGRDLNDMIDRLARLLEAQRRFTSDAAHELRSPLTALRGQLEVALRRPRSPQEYQACLESCLEDAERLAALADDMLALARLEGRPVRGQDWVQLRTVAEETLLQLSDAAKAAQAILVVRPGPEVSVRGDALQLGRLLRNLVENAIRVSPAGSAVEVEIRQEADRAVLAVLDRGPGVPAQLREQLFVPFFRGDAGRARQHGGAGLGLAIAREIARVHGGDLIYRDRPGGGAHFVASLTLE